MISWFLSEVVQGNTPSLFQCKKNAILDKAIEDAF
jgi:hypothetical protein